MALVAPRRLAEYESWYAPALVDSYSLTMQIELAAIADYALVDVQGKMSIMGIFDVMGVPQLPFVAPRLFVCLRIATQPIEAGTRHTVAVQLHAYDGQPIGPRLESEFIVSGGTVPGMAAYTQAVLGFDGLAFPRAETYAFDVAIDNNHQRSIPLRVTLVQPRPS